MQGYFSTTCAALSSARGKAGVALIRVSGEDAVKICSAVFKPLRGNLEESSANRAIYGEIFRGGEKFDTGIATVFRAPHSFTGEDTVEICCHGSEVGVSMLLSALYENGAYPAQPGEFTKRAFLNGKLDLTQAEAIGELIDAESEAALRLSSAKASGLLGKRISEIIGDIMSVLSSVYAYIDYPDEDIADMSSAQMSDAIQSILSKARHLLSTYDTGKAISHGVECAIIGAPNVGKSSLLNLLCGNDRAIVTDIEGTTRDVITERVRLGNITLLLSDTAGIRESEDVIEKIGIERSLEALDRAELVFLMFDGSREFSSLDREIIGKASQVAESKNIITVINKADAAATCDAKQVITKELEKAGLPCPCVISTKDTESIGVLSDAANRFYPAGDDEIRGGLILTNARQNASVQKATVYLENALEALRVLTPDMACAELEAAAAALGETDGRSVNESIVSEIFAHFCVGK